MPSGHGSSCSCTPAPASPRARASSRLRSRTTPTRRIRTGAAIRSAISERRAPSTRASRGRSSRARGASSSSSPSSFRSRCPPFCTAPPSSARTSPRSSGSTSRTSRTASAPASRTAPTSPAPPAAPLTSSCSDAGRRPGGTPIDTPGVRPPRRSRGGGPARRLLTSWCSMGRTKARIRDMDLVAGRSWFVCSCWLPRVC
mmetsp:Transcript_17373/g.69807  ORF Transcript_17373/g.69807 Transcript_17373/m.69807 type:complete len:200 (-) Transcript_17373:64-663(-)